MEVGDVAKIDRYVDIGGKIRQRQSSAPVAAPRRRRPLDMPREFRMISRRGTGRAFFDYLADRAFDRVASLVEQYELRYCMTGHFRYRIIIPVFSSDGVLVSWTGRDVTGRSAVRYRTLSDDPVKAEAQGYPPAVVSLKSTVLNLNRCRGGRSLFVCEGPFDALKLDWHVDDGNAVALFGMPESQQLATLCRAARSYDDVNVVLDRDAKARAVAFVDSLRSLLTAERVRWRPLPAGIKDPGEMNPQQARKFILESACGPAYSPATISRPLVPSPRGKFHAV